MLRLRDERCPTKESSPRRRDIDTPRARNSTVEGWLLCATSNPVYLSINLQQGINHEVNRKISPQLWERRMEHGSGKSQGGGRLCRRYDAARRCSRRADGSPSCR